MIPLEDSYQDITNKAIRGLGLTPENLAGEAGVTSAELREFSDGKFSAEVARKIAPLLGLDAEALVVSGERGWHPGEISVPGLWQFHNSAGMEPNFYLAHHAASNTAVAFDTGDDASELLDTLAKLGCGLRALCLTHTHHDHIADVSRIKAAYPEAELFIGELEPIPGARLVKQGQVLTLGGLTLECRLTAGHSVGGITYVISGLEQPVAIVGDAVFAGSMGGGKISWQGALATNRAQIFTLPDATVLCPGHGPLTTVALEKAHNPFYPEFK